MKEIKIANYSIYSDGCWEQSEMNFLKLYKGVRVSASKENGYIRFSIRTKKVKDVIWVRGDEKLLDLMFDDEHCSVSCNFDRREKNPSKDRLEFTQEVYEELKTNIPEFLKEQGIEFETVENERDKILLF